MIFHTLYFFTFIMNLKPIKVKRVTDTIYKTISLGI